MEQDIDEILNAPFNPDIELSPVELLDLNSTVATPGFRVIQKLLKSSVDFIGLSLLNTPSDQKDKILVKHISWKVAGIMYSRMIELINRERERYELGVQSRRDRFVDSTEGLDLDSIPEEEFF